MSETDQALREELERLKAENLALKAKTARGLRLQVSAKGGVSLYGVRRFPVTFYLEEWQAILDHGENIRTFMKENESALKKKGDASSS